MFKYITSRPLWVNILVGIGIVIAVFIVFVFSLNRITHHGEAKSVPSITGKRLSEIQPLLEKEGFNLVIQDSVYYDSLPPTMVIRQVPEADDVVKINRTIYVTINRTVPPDVPMPNLIGYSFRNAEMILKNMGLRLGDTTFKPDFAKNSVLEQLYKGQSISTGTKIRMGSTISLVIGSGIGNADMAVPKLIGLTYDEAKILLETNGLIVGSVIPDPLVKDTANAFIYKQSPLSRTEDGFQVRIRPGQMIDVWLSVEKPVVDSTIMQPPSTTTPVEENPEQSN
jgi:eukaryotic-like serine/threonine-protein kinase